MTHPLGVGDEMLHDHAVAPRCKGSPAFVGTSHPVLGMTAEL
eukprot:CAMPEP_0204328362 /NCGR_PEP_ID=MMETSP0469-20131031/13302_1 /ASSEMBLY_ACC=CAM_ASM_000384 /TAXON_ID=2969 /ORGANISM="Oxyrrhis marina" /LENGTH=41 /DNA_ID= /DNA_START= /DNA_END= /DNA_ORIENTATION=